MQQHVTHRPNTFGVGVVTSCPSLILLILVSMLSDCDRKDLTGCYSNIRCGFRGTV